MKNQNRRISCLILAIIVTEFIAVTNPALGQVINEDVKIFASDGSSFDWFGYTISIDNGIVAVGSQFDDDHGTSSGSAYLFDASTGVQITKYLPFDNIAGDQFGASIDIKNGIVAIGALGDDDSGLNSGSAYLFNSSTGAQIAKLLPTDGAATDGFGVSIAIDNNVVAVGSFQDDDNGSNSGSAYLFNATTGIQFAKLLPSDGTADAGFGRSIAIFNGIVVVGAPLAVVNGSLKGAAYLFNSSTGNQIAKITASVGAAFDWFGNSVAIDNDVIVIGAYLHDEFLTPMSGAAYLFNASTFTQFAKILPNDVGTSDFFGSSVAIDNGIVAVGAYANSDNGIFSGSAYLFDAFTGTQILKFLPSDGATNDQFGFSIAIDNDTIEVGANQDNTEGSGYVFSVPLVCIADVTGDGFVDVTDLLELIAAWGPCPKGCNADLNDDLVVDVNDLLEVIGAWGVCP